MLVKGGRLVRRDPDIAQRLGLLQILSTSARSVSSHAVPSPALLSESGMENPVTPSLLETSP